MKVTKDKVEGCQAFLTVEMEPPEVEKEMAAAYRRLAKKVNIPGFRKGKAPQAILEGYLGKESALEEALNHLIPRAYDDAVKEQGLQPFARPSIEIEQTEPVVFKAVVPLPPEVDIAGYQDVRVEPVEAEAITEAKIDEVIEEIRHQHAEWEPAEKGVTFNDLAVLDVASTAGGEPFINQSGAQYQVIAESTSPLPGFAEQLVDVKKGETKEFKLKVPEDYPRQEVAGKEAEFKVTVTEVKQEKLPEVTDEFAKQVGPEYNSVADLRQYISRTMQERAEEKAKKDYEDKLVEALVQAGKVEFPPVLVDLEIESIMEDQARRIQMGGGNLEAYLESIGKNEEQVREELKPIATKRVTSSLVLGKFAELEKIEVADEDVDKEIDEMVARADEKNREEMRKYLDNEPSRQSLRHVALTRKTLERLGEIAGGKKAAAKPAAAGEETGKSETVETPEKEKEA